MSRRLIVATAFAALLATPLLAGQARAEMVTFHAKLDGASQVPPVTTSGSGMATATLDTKTDMLTYDITYSGLTGKPVAAHIHGPAPVGKNAGVLVPFKGSLASPMKGTLKLTAAQAKDVMDGMTYINIHTAMHKGGEIRGQLMK